MMLASAPLQQRNNIPRNSVHAVCHQDRAFLMGHQCSLYPSPSGSCPLDQTQIYLLWITFAHRPDLRTCLMPHPLPSTQDGKQDGPLWSLSGVGVLVSFHCCDRTCDINNLQEEGQFQRIQSRVPGSIDSRPGER